ncbi:MAG: hypothetical protein A2Z16_15525 [Chloroflexi bacterium RBG_16_54_18]|nr:MAG: hypothetical protein A2Z16_15525 [Chloroflexi bacterium RBG_16_54_18]
MNNPVLFISPKFRKRVLVISMMAALALLALLNVVNRQLISSASPYGIISFELAGTLDSAQKILAGWGETDRLIAAFSLGLGYVFMLAYPLAIGLACSWIAEELALHHHPHAAFGIRLAWAQGLAALLDAIENISLMEVLLGIEIALWPRIAQICAAFKFVLVISGLLYALYGLVSYLVVSRQK